MEELKLIPDELFEYMKRRGIKYQSPYSCSFYNKNNKSWSFTEDKTIRVANHWNFTTHYDSGVVHCPIDSEVIAESDWVVAKYNAKTKVYDFIKGYNNSVEAPQHFIKLCNKQRKAMLIRNIEEMENLKKALELQDLKEIKRIFNVRLFSKRRLAEFQKQFKDGLFKITTNLPDNGILQTHISNVGYNRYRDTFHYSAIMSVEKYNQLPKYLIKKVERFKNVSN